MPVRVGIMKLRRKVGSLELRHPDNGCGNLAQSVGFVHPRILPRADRQPNTLRIFTDQQ